MTPNLQPPIRPFGNGQGTFGATPTGVRPPPIRGTAQTSSIVQV